MPQADHQLRNALRVFDAITNVPAVLLFQHDKSRRGLGQSLGKGLCGKEVNGYAGGVSRPTPRT